MHFFKCDLVETIGIIREYLTWDCYSFIPVTISCSTKDNVKIEPLHSEKNQATLEGE